MSLTLVVTTQALCVSPESLLWDLELRRIQPLPISQGKGMDYSLKERGLKNFYNILRFFFSAKVSSQCSLTLICHYLCVGWRFPTPLLGHPFYKSGIGLWNIGEMLPIILFLTFMVSPEVEIKKSHFAIWLHVYNSEVRLQDASARLSKIPVHLSPSACIWKNFLQTS